MGTVPPGMKSSYSVRQEDDKIVVKTTGTQQVEAVETMREKIIKIASKNSRPLDILVISKGVGAPDISAVQTAVRGLQDLPFRRLAVAGATPDRLESARMVVRGGNDQERLKVFRSEEDARAWLDEASPPKA
jgi:hypothetical protein